MRTPVPRIPPLDVGAWYIDSESHARYRLLSVEDETVGVVDEFGVRRTVNRSLWERDMRREKK